MDSDFLLIRQIKSGKSEAGERFVKKYYSSIFQYCFLHIHDRDFAEDLTQETFVRFFESLKTYEDQGKAKNYLYCIAGNLMKNYFKKKKEVLVDEIPEMPEKISENSMADIEVRMDIEQAVDRLPDELKEITILFFFQCLKQKEIAEILHINLSLVKYRIGKAKKILYECLEV